MLREEELSESLAKLKVTVEKTAKKRQTRTRMSTSLKRALREVGFLSVTVDNVQQPVGFAGGKNEFDVMVNAFLGAERNTVYRYVRNLCALVASHEAEISIRNMLHGEEWDVRQDGWLFVGTVADAISNKVKLGHEGWKS